MSAIVTPTHFLKIEEISGDDRIQDEMAEITGLWISAARERKISAASEAERAVFDASRIVNSTAWQRTQRRKGNFRRSFAVVIAYDCDLMIRAFAFIKQVSIQLARPDGRIKEKRCIQLKFLSSDPANLCKPSRLKGAGSAILQYLFDKCVHERCSGVLVEPLEQSVQFYGSRGFTPCAYLAPDGSKKSALFWKPPKIDAALIY